VVPMFHAGSWCIPYAAAMSGMKLVLCADNQSDRICELFNSEAVTHTAGVPTVWLSLIDHVERTGADLGKLHTVIIGGSSAPPATIRWFRERGIRVNHLWGMTEMSPVGTVGAPPANWDRMSEDEKLTYMARPGRSMFGVELRTVDDDGTVLPRDGRSSGRLQTRGPGVVKRYFKADADAVDADQWFDTGDVAAIHPDGSIQITDRSKDVIKSGGEWISSIDLENIAVAHPGIVEAAVIGIKHPKWDERPIVVAIKKPGATVTKEELLKFYEGKIAKWWMPDDVVFVDQLPHTATGKLSKLTLRGEMKDYRLPG